MFALFAAPPEKDLDWQEDGVAGSQSLPGRVYRFVTRNVGRAADTGELTEADRQALRKLHQTIQQDHRRFREPLAFQHLHRFNDGTGQRAVLARREAVAGGAA